MEIDLLRRYGWRWDRVGALVNRELEDYSEEVRKGWKEARCNGFLSVEDDSLLTIEGNGWRW